MKLAFGYDCCLTAHDAQMQSQYWDDSYKFLHEVSF